VRSDTGLIDGTVCCPQARGAPPLPVLIDGGDRRILATILFCGQAARITLVVLNDEQECRLQADEVQTPIVADGVDPSQSAPDQFPFELRKRKQDIQRESAKRGAGIELLGHSHEAHVVFLEHVQHAREIAAQVSPADTRFKQGGSCVWIGFACTVRSQL
jgi:hypothetical protein